MRFCFLKQAIPCSKLTIETLEQNITTYFTPCASVSLINFEQVNAYWLVMLKIILLLLVLLNIMKFCQKLNLK